jgi:hypothetical protein
MWEELATKVKLTLKGLVMTVNVTSVNALCELVLILNDWQKSLFYVRCYRPRFKRQHKRDIAYYSGINSS